MTVRLPFAVPTNDEFSVQTPDQLRDLISQARDAAGQYAEMDVDDLSEDDIDTMKELQAVSAKAKAGLKASTEGADRQGRAAKAFAALMDVLDEDEAPEDEDSEPDDGAEEEPPAAPEVKKAPKKAASFARRPTVPGVAQAAKVDKASVPGEGEDGKALKASLVAAAGTNMVAGAEITWDNVATQVLRNWNGYRALGDSGFARNGVAQIQIEYPEELTASGLDSDDQTAFVNRVASEARLPGGSLLASIALREKELLAQGKSQFQASLTAAGIGWCAPSEVLYDLCELESNDGMLDVPEMNIQRGGIKWTTGPDFRSIWSGAGFFDFTEAQVIAGVTKPCMSVACPPFSEERMDAVGTCITADLLSLRGYQELNARFVRGAMVAHNHRVNAKVINAIATGSTAITLSSGTFGVDQSMLTQFLAALALGVTDYKYGNRMSLSTTLEIVVPYWVLSALVTDMSRRAFWDGETGVDQMALTLAKINDWARARGARVQWVYDWQDAFYWVQYPTSARPLHTRFGADPTVATDVVTNWDTQFSFLMYAAGTWVRGNADVINLDTVYDSTLLAQNKATQLFAEQGLLVAKTCFDSRIYTIGGTNVGPTGQTFAPVAYPVVTP